MQRCGGHGLCGRDREPRRDARPLIDRRMVARIAGEAGEDLGDERRNRRREVGFLLDDGDLVVEF